jgi:hypothetical protein
MGRLPFYEKRELSASYPGSRAFGLGSLSLGFATPAIQLAQKSLAALNSYNNVAFGKPLLAVADCM